MMTDEGVKRRKELTRAVALIIRGRLQAHLTTFFNHQGKNGRYARCNLQAAGAISAGIFYRGLPVPGKSAGVTGPIQNATAG